MMADVVECFVGHTAGECTVADDADDAPVGVVVGDLQSGNPRQGG